ncbi:MAG: histidine phosphatase family protein [Candidatus Eremiobacteraeota bacterium]|nr:histidine phosphatase family protein [Candidatus Eremiobacteraeota bacterium]
MNLTMQQWPDELIIVRHGESAGNVARDRALAAGVGVIDIAKRDCDVPLSELGERQSVALGEWLARNADKPHAVLSSPFVRAQQTSHLSLKSAGWEDVPVVVDERLREKEFGILDRLTRRGIEETHPDQADMSARLGKFYYRPPGGESWTDVILRLRSIVDTLTRDYARRRVLVVAHQVVVLCFRYLFECLDERAILAIDREGDVANCSTTVFRYDANAGEHGGMSLVWYNRADALHRAGEPVTTEPDVPVAPK